LSCRQQPAQGAAQMGQPQLLLDGLLLLAELLQPDAQAQPTLAVLRAELDAFYAHLYGLTRDELRYILDPADLMGPDYPSETFRVLKGNEIRQLGEYRTQRLVLEAWDRLFG
jgi:hypothetical protein